MTTPKMTRQDFQFIADVLRDSEPVDAQTSDELNIRHSQWLRTVDAFARELKATNGSFDRDRFVRAAGVA